MHVGGQLPWTGGAGPPLILVQEIVIGRDLFLPLSVTTTNVISGPPLQTATWRVSQPNPWKLTENMVMLSN